jgi:hypothetical protein
MTPLFVESIIYGAYSHISGNISTLHFSLSQPYCSKWGIMGLRESLLMLYLRISKQWGDRYFLKEKLIMEVFLAFRLWQSLTMAQINAQVCQSSPSSLSNVLLSPCPSHDGLFSFKNDNHSLTTHKLWPSSSLYLEYASLCVFGSPLITDPSSHVISDPRLH